MTDNNDSHTPRDSHYARLRRGHRDRNAPHAPPGPRRKPQQAGSPSPDGRVRLYGIHTVSAALGNPARTLHRLLVTRNALQRLEIDADAPPCPLELVEPRRLDAELGSEAVHQGVMLECDPLRERGLAEIGTADLVLVLDQVTDPHNVGAILRSAAAFGAGAVITTSRHSPQESGVLAKAASGALELVPYVQIGNLAEGLTALGRQDFLTVGLAGEAEAELDGVLAGRKLALILGSEGKGLRQKTRETAAVLARLEMRGAMTSLNVSNAAAIALYAARRFLG